MRVDQEKVRLKKQIRFFRKKYLCYSIAIFYLFSDFYLFDGPFRLAIKKIANNDQESLAEIAKREGVVATVNAYPIYKLELERRFNQYCLKNGINVNSISNNRIDSIKSLCLNNLIVDKLVWFHSYHTPVEMNIEQLNDSLIDFRKGFESSEEFNRASQSQGFSVKRIDSFTENQFMQRLWIERVISKYIQVTDDEILERYKIENDTRKNPERLKVQQIFFASLDKDPDDLKKNVYDVYLKSQQGSNFEPLVETYSEDPSSKTNQGHLDWLTKERVTKTFYDQINQLKIGETSPPFQTKIGWHIVRLVDRKSQNQLPIKAIKNELAAVIEAEKRQAAIKALIHYMKRKAKIRYMVNLI